MLFFYDVTLKNWDTLHNLHNLLLDYYEHNPWLLWEEREKKNTNSNQKNFLAVPILCLRTTYTWQILVTARFMEELIILNLKLPGTWQMSLMIALS